LKLFKRQRKVRLEFECIACGHPFKRRVDRVFVDLNTFEKDPFGHEGRSPYVIPERIVCPRCQAVDQFELASSSCIKIQTEMLKRIVIKPDPDDPIQTIRFGLSDGTPMHPLDGLDMYAEQVSRHPERTDLRVKYANTLRSLGYVEEAEAQYPAVLERDPTEMEALMNLAALHARRAEKRATHDYLRRVIACARQSRHPQRDQFSRIARLVLDGEMKLDDFRAEAPAQLLTRPAQRPPSARRRTSPRRRKKKKRRSK